MAKKNLEKEIGWLLKEKYNNKPTKQFYSDVKRLEKGEPLDYVIGFTEFLGCKIDLSKRPLIPRPETEFWVEKAIEEMKNRKPFGAAQGKILHILDMFAGSGCIGIAILKHIKNSQVVFSDINKDNLKQIEINCKLNSINEKRYKIIESDVFKNIKGDYDYIFANPPYIADYRRSPSASLRAILRNRIQKSVLKYEPKQALFGGKDGFLYLRQFLKKAKNYLNKQGTIYMEFDSPQKKGIEKITKESGYQSCEFYKDQYGKWRYVMIK